MTSSAGDPPSEWPLHARVIQMRPADFPEPRLDEAATAADASRATIWQGNCPAKKGFLQTALSKARRTTVFRYTSFVDARFR